MSIGMEMISAVGGRVRGPLFALINRVYPAGGNFTDFTKAVDKMEVCKVVFEGRVTNDRKMIKEWVEMRNGRPAVARQSSGTDTTEVLNIAFPELDDHTTFTEITWDEFFEKLDEKRLAFLYRDQEKNGTISRAYSFL